MEIRKYFLEEYLGNYKLYKENIGTCLCGRVLNKYFNQNEIKLSNPLYFFIAQYELNLLAQVIYSHFNKDFQKWIDNTAPYIDCRCTYASHPIQILETLVREGKNLKDELTKELILKWDLFIKEYVEDICTKIEFEELNSEKLFEAIKNDKDFNNKRVLTFFKNQK